MSRRNVIATFAAAAALAAPAGAFGATPQQIFADASDGHLGAHYSKTDLQRALKDATVQGYGNQIIQITLNNSINNSNSNSNSNSNTNNNTNSSTSSATNNNSSTNSNNNSATGGNANANATSNSTSNSQANGGCCSTKGQQVFTPPLRQHHYQAPSGKHTTHYTVPSTSSTLPFTGSNLATFSSLGVVLLSGGLLLRLMARRRQQF
jgi:hypothetical protein